ncbi:MAG: formate hydrogenlyase subunit 4 [Candidatus Acididesulfobacter guangdongensis]|uniref:Formate hydrogenlyase subunit 4 n=1 Tax=Acididesulfobacter guangdongensis TaxID=2597225 RepID=A0A519BJ50_ACIG2|nr:MAG: formate hydrogenlyase subunit 4 [Candidatus Acididesulfobacter guangdongensis]
MLNNDLLNFNAVLIGIAQILILILIAPFVNSYINKIKSILRGQQGRPLFQGYKDIFKLIRKEVVLSEDASYISRFAPYIVFVSILVSACFLPVFSSDALLSFTGDIIALVYTIGLGTFFMALYGMDQASSFGGLGSSRDILIASLAEPTLMLVIFTFALQTRTTNISQIFIDIHKNGFLNYPVSYVLALMAFLIISIAENGRIPVDNPDTHLELTMVHEAMILEGSGRHLALFEYSSYLKLIIFITLASNIFLPIGVYGGIPHSLSSFSFLTILYAILFYILKVLIFATPIAFIEISMAKLRFFRVPDFLMLGFVLSIISLVLYSI